MLYSAKDIRKCKLSAKDGELGSVYDLLFDDRTWRIQYVVADTARWLAGKRVLIPREALGTPDWGEAALDVGLTRDEIENSAGVESDPPLSHDAKLRYYQSYVWTSYPWGGFIGAAPVDLEQARKAQDPPETHLRSAREVTDYHVEATDGSLGHVEDFLFAGEDWTIHYAVIDTRNWLPGKKVVVPPTEISRMDWAERTAHVKLTKEEIEGAPRLQLSDSSKVLGPRLMEIR